MSLYALCNFFKEKKIWGAGLGDFSSVGAGFLPSRDPTP